MGHGPNWKLLSAVASISAPVHSVATALDQKVAFCCGSQPDGRKPWRLSWLPRWFHPHPHNPLPHPPTSAASGDEVGDGVSISHGGPRDVRRLSE